MAVKSGIQISEFSKCVSCKHGTPGKLVITNKHNNVTLDIHFSLKQTWGIAIFEDTLCELLIYIFFFLQTMQLYILWPLSSILPENPTRHYYSCNLDVYYWAHPPREPLLPQSDRFKPCGHHIQPCYAHLSHHCDIIVYHSYITMNFSTTGLWHMV